VINEKLEQLKLAKKFYYNERKPKKTHHIRHRAFHFFTAKIRVNSEWIDWRIAMKLHKRIKEYSLSRYCGTLEQDLRELNRQSPD